MNVDLVLKILGYICLGQSGATVPWLLYAARFEHFMLPAFAFSLLVSAVLGAGIFAYEYHQKAQYPQILGNISRQNFTIREAMALLSCGWFLVAVLGALPYWFSGHFTIVEALFENLSSISTTGISCLPQGTRYASSLVWWHIWGQWLGGIGEIIAFVLLLARLGSEVGNLFSAEVQGVSAERTLSRAGKSVKTAFWLYVIITIILSVLLFGTNLPLTTAVQAAMATISTGGFVHLQDKLFANSSFVRELIILVFMLIASVNFVLFYRIVLQKRWRFIKEDTESKWYLSLIMVVFFLLTINLWYTDTYDLVTSAQAALFQTVSVISTTGFATADFSNWPPFCHLLLFYVAMIGGCSGSAAGGFKISRLVILMKVCWVEVLKTLHPNIVRVVTMCGRPVPASALASVGRYSFLYFLVFTFLVLAISLTGIGMLESMSIIVASLSNLGSVYSLIGGQVDCSSLPDFGKLILCLAMLLGRIELFTIFMIIQPGFWTGKRSW